MLRADLVLHCSDWKEVSGGAVWGCSRTPAAWWVVREGRKRTGNGPQQRKCFLNLTSSETALDPITTKGLFRIKLGHPSPSRLALARFLGLPFPR